MTGNREADLHLIGANGSGPSGGDRSSDPLAAGAPDEVDLRDKVALIVDGKTTDGQALAVALARWGMHIILLYFHEEHRSAVVIKERVEAHERHCLLISWADLGDGDAADVDAQRFSEQAMERIRETFGRLDVFVNLSAHPRPLDGDSTPQTQRRSLRSRLFPHLNIMKAALHQIAESDPDG